MPTPEKKNAKKIKIKFAFYSIFRTSADASAPLPLLLLLPWPATRIVLVIYEFVKCALWAGPHWTTPPCPLPILPNSISVQFYQLSTLHWACQRERRTRPAHAKQFVHSLLLFALCFCFFFFFFFCSFFIFFFLLLVLPLLPLKWMDSFNEYLTRTSHRIESKRIETV